MDEMELIKIDLQNLTSAAESKAESYWFENKNIGLENTLFHRITIPLKEFDSGLDYDQQPTRTAIVFDWIELKLDDPSDLDGLELSSSKYPEAEGSIYIGSAYNWCDVLQINITQDGEGSFVISGAINIEFENEGVAKNEEFSFKTTLKYIED